MTTAEASMFTAEQRRAIDARSGPLLLSANAGSGKTSVIVERFVAAVLEDGAPVDAILAITFTDKAAAELRQRIRERFVALDQAEHARALESAHISTIHGFCAQVLRAHPLPAGIDPAFEVLSENEVEPLRREAFDDAFADLVDAAGEPALELAAAYGIPALRDLIAALHAELRSRGQSVPALPDPPAPADPSAAHAELVAARAAAAARLAAGRIELATIAAAQEALDRCATLLASRSEADAEAEADIERLDAVRLPSHANVADLHSEEADRYRRALAACRQTVIDRCAEPVYALLAQLLSAFARRYATAKRTRSRLDFEDLELGVRDLFAAEPGLARSYAARFALVMVDEFQDTNALQLEIIDAITQDNLFAVGDEQQSIYGFRHADIELFRRRRRELAARDATASLEVNFRSHEPLLDALNAAFAPRLGEDFLPLRSPAGASPGGRPPLIELLVTERDGWKPDEGGDPSPPDLGATVPGSIAWRVAEARMLAQRIHDLVDTTGFGYGDVVVLLRATGDMLLFERALEDQSVPTYLVGGRGYWSHPQVRDLVAWLAVLANPHDSPRLYEVLASPLVGASSDALVLLAAAAERIEQTPWSTLEAIFGGAGDADGLLERLPPADSERLAAFVARCASERGAAPRRSLDALIERAVTVTSYDLAVLAMPGGERRMANVRKLMRLAREHEAHEGRDLRAFIDLVDDLAEERFAEAREGEAPTQSESDGPADAHAVPAVRLMTIHRAKGLEFPVVCVADLGRRPPADARVVLLGADGRVGLKLRTLNGLNDPAFQYAELHREAREASFAEEQRLFYVAMTRAQERLVLSGMAPVGSWPEDKPGCAPLAWIGPAFLPDVAALSPEHPRIDQMLEWGERSVPVTAVLNAPATVGEVLREPSQRPSGTAVAALDRVDAPLPLALPEPAPVSLDHLSYSALEEYGRCGYRFYLRRVLRLPAVDEAAGVGWPEREPGADADADQVPMPTDGRIGGTVVHELLERMDFAQPAPVDTADVQDLAVAQGARLDVEEATRLAKMVGRFAASGTRARLAAAEDVRREAAFAFGLERDGAAPLLVTGVVDAIGSEPEGAFVVDYKSDRVGETDLAELVQRAYGIQRLIYALAALRGGARAVEVVHCFLERADEPVSERFAAADAADLERRLGELAAGALAGSFTVATAPNRELCAGCPGRGTLCSWPLQATFAEPASDPARR